MSSIGWEEAMHGPNGRSERILVSIRLRPLNNKERAKNDVSDWECVNDTTIICKNNLLATDKSLYPTAYIFDRVFAPDCSTRKVYEEGAKKVALSVLNGINSSIFAYGQTSSGKTFTMSGITEYAVADIYHYIEKHKEREFILKFSAIEIYNECVKDLLSSDSTPRRLLDDPERGTVVERLIEETLKDWNHFIELLSFCKTQRQIGETSFNETSSRSHQILRLMIESSRRQFLGNDKSSSLAAFVNFVDLAGSERASQTLSAGTRLKEGCHINRSLLTLGTVVRKLSKGKTGHIPFRDSKLTRILQSSLGGSARTAIICTMSPARSHVEQTRNTLLFASCAKEVATNAQVNVVMSDKALVKQLQRELARLENELKNSGPACLTSDSAALLSKKDLEIEKLKKEVAELARQRDLAQSLIKKVLQVDGDDMSSTEFESPDPRYPKASERSKSTSFQGAERVRSYYPSPYSDRESFSADENFFRVPGFELEISRNNSFSLLTATDFDELRNDLYPTDFEELYDVSLKESGLGVMCNKSEDHRYTDSNLADLSPDPYTDSNASSPGASGLTVVDHRDEANPDLDTSGLKEDKEMNSFVLSNAACSQENLTYTSRNLKEVRSKSCRASLMMNPSSYWFEKEEIINTTPPPRIEKHFTGRPEGFQRKDHINQLDYNNNAERLQSNGSAYSGLIAAVDVQNFNSSTDDESDKKGTLAPIRKAEKSLEDLLAEQAIPLTRSGSIMSARSSVDVGMDTMHSDEESHSDWPSEFRRFQKEIIELWHDCNVPLSHRTYFFLLFKGDPSDSIYMEVELRRLSYLKQTLSQGNQKGENGRKVSHASSMRNVQRERHMLSKQMKRRLSKSDRHNIYLKWGIQLSSRNRRMQLAYRLWTETDNMEHIGESAAVVAKLVGPVEPDQAFKEMFGLNFAPRPPRSRRSYGWSSTIRHIL